LYSSEVEPKYNAARMSIAGVSLLVSEKAGAGNATVTYGSVSLVQGTCTYFGPAGGGSVGIVTGLGLPAFQPPQNFSTSGMTASGETSPAMMSVVFCGRYHRSKNVFEYAYSFGMFSMSVMNPMVVCL
jgi:hypothetical protein